MRRRTTAAAGVLFTAALSFGFSGTAQAQAADRDCPDFPSQAAAQAAYDAVPGDPERLDRDNDGVACEDQAYAPASSTTGATSASQVSTRPAGAVAAGDGSSSGDEASALPYVLGGVALTAAGGAAFAARRSSRATV
jgi:excalibur calcium-binding domain-containing protein